ncbi:hypothetical protein A3860_07690 [Niastella vici]|uniref:Uncharacterized protein n=1 Tax=Niastella vici TaxID=1703345 RepID=A0A1V9FIL7_9BACT|nr:hypothetical protein [Niastella vici]OQP58198.1 hypothetical protein A3860_07690 [Niastella vici]
MKWNLISNAPTGIKEFQLVQDGLVLAIMKYSPEQQSIRITFDDQHLVFFLEDTGYANRILFKNVYGVDLGKFTHRNHSGRLEINNEVYDYNLVAGPNPKLIVHQHNKQEPLAVCQIPDIPIRDAAFHVQAGIVLSICRYATMPARKSQLP